MDPASATGLLASCIGICGLAVQIAHTLDNLLQNLADAPKTLYTLQMQVALFSGILSNVKRQIEPYVENQASLDEFANQRLNFVTSSHVLLKQVDAELQFVLKRSKIHNSFKLSFIPRVLMVWNQDRIRQCCDDIQRHVVLYSGLELSQRASFADSTQTQAESLAKARQVVEEASELARLCLRFRILLIGKVGHGKTRLCHYILGICRQKEKLYDRATPASNVWKEQTWPGENDNLALHDAGGFDVGGENQKGDPVRMVKHFIQSRRFAKDRTPVPLERQIHCIWYCISCVDNRPIQPIDKRFFMGEFDTGEIPIVIIFTQYDALVEKWRKQLNARRRTKDVEMAAFKYYEQELKQEVLRLIPNDANVKIIRTGIDDDGVEYSLTRGSDPGECISLF